MLHCGCSNWTLKMSFADSMEHVELPSLRMTDQNWWTIGLIRFHAGIALCFEGTRSENFPGHPAMRHHVVLLVFSLSCLIFSLPPLLGPHVDSDSSYFSSFLILPGCSLPCSPICAFIRVAWVLLRPGIPAQCFATRIPRDFAANDFAVRSM